MFKKSRSLGSSKSRLNRRRKFRKLEKLETRLNLASVSVVGGELRIDGLVSEDNDMTVDYAADVYTITDTNPLTLLTGGAGTQVDPNTVTIDGTMVTDRVRIFMRDGNNAVAINDNGGAGWGDEGLRINNDTRTIESTTIGAGGVTVQSGGTRGQVEILTDVIDLGGDVTTSDGDLIELGTDTGDTVDVTDNSVVDAGTGPVTVHGAISSANDSDLSATGTNIQFLSDATGFGTLNVEASDLAIFSGNVGAGDSDIEGLTQVSIAGTLSSDTALISSPDINLASVTSDDLTIEAGDLAVSGAIAPAVLGGSLATLRSRVAGNDITVLNAAAAPTDPDSLILDTTDLGLFAGYELLIIGGEQGGTQTGMITLVNNGTAASDLILPTDAVLIADTIDIDEGFDAAGQDTEFRTTTLNVNNRRAFRGAGNVVFQGLSTAEGGDDTLTINGRAQAFTATVPDLAVAADASVTINAQMGEFASIAIETPVASFDSGVSAMTSRGDITYNTGSAAGDFSIAGGLHASGDIMVNGGLELLGANLLYARGGGSVMISGAVTGNGNALDIRGTLAMPAPTVTLGGGASDLGNLRILHAVDVVLGGTIDVNVAGGDILIRNSGNLSIGGDVLAADKVDLVFGTADLAGGDRLIDSVADARVQLVGDLVGGNTLTVDILGGLFARSGADGGVTVTVV